MTRKKRSTPLETLTSAIGAAVVLIAALPMTIIQTIALD